MKNPAELHIAEMQKMLRKLIKERNITFVTATQIPRPHIHHTQPTRYPSSGPDIVIVDHMNKFR